MSEDSSAGRRGVALVAVLYFLVVCALVIVALLYVQRSRGRAARSTTVGAQLFAAAESAAFGALADWQGAEREAQAIGSAKRVVSQLGDATVELYLTRLTTRIFSLVANARAPSGIARRVELLVRLPVVDIGGGALVSAVNVTVGSGVRFAVDTGACGDSSGAITLSPNATLAVDPAISVADRPTAHSDSIAGDSATHLRVGDAWWNELTRAADLALPADSRVTPNPMVVGGSCVRSAANWGDPTSTSSPCAHRTLVIYAAGDLTIDGGVGQGVLLVDGRLTIAGPFIFSGQIVVRHGLETRADNITISGIVHAWRESVDPTASHATTNEVMLTYATTIRRSVCDARHGVASSLQPRRVHDRAFAELF